MCVLTVLLGFSGIARGEGSVVPGCHLVISKYIYVIVYKILENNSDIK